MNKVSILYVDDERENLENFEIFFERDYQIYTCLSASEAFDLLKTTEILVVISDQRMPEMTGIEFFEIIKGLYPDVVRVMLTAYTEENYLLEAINRGGVYRYVTKPWNKVDLEAVLRSAVETGRLKQENRVLIAELHEKVLALSHNQETLTNIFNSSSDGIIVLSTDHRIISANRAMHEMMQYSEEEVVGKSIMSFIHPLSHNVLDQRWGKLSSHELPIIEYPMNRRDGQLLFVEISTRPISFEGKPAYLSVARDVTEKKQFERQLYMAAVNAEEKERERIARDLHDGIGPLLSTLKIYLHEITQTSCCETHNAAVGMANEIMAEAILSVKEISNNVSPHILRNFGLCHAVSNFIERLQHKTALQFDYRPLLTERADEIIEITLYRITTELINNTIKYASAKKVVLVIEYCNNRIHLQYSDDGCGFDFEEKVARGAGLGLQNLHSRLRTIGGQLLYKTAVGQGVMVDIEI